MRKRTVEALAASVLWAASTLGCAAPAGETARPASPAATSQATFDTPEEAADALIAAARDFDVAELVGILGPDGRDLVTTVDRDQDRIRAGEFAARAQREKRVVVDPNDPERATLFVGIEQWPLPIPIVKTEGRWRFDTAAGRDEISRRRIGANELDVIGICRGYDEAQQEYASTRHDDRTVHQYAQRIISTPGKQDGLAWQNADGSWGGPVGEGVARAVAEGFEKGEPYHGYYFKVLTGQGPSAPLGQLDYMIDGAMIGGFALVAWPADHGVTGVQTFIVSYDGVVFQKDLGPDTEKIASAMERYDPDESWTPTEDDWN
jgi:hypothetical protein